VTYRLVNLPNGRVDIVFKIDEGDKTGIRSESNFVRTNTMRFRRIACTVPECRTTEMNFSFW